MSGRVLVTGAGGFIGGALCARLLRDAWQPRALLRSGALPGVPCVHGDLLDMQAMRAACTGVERIFHCAGRAHVDERAGGGGEHFRSNLEGTRVLAEAALAEGVRRLVFLSSVKAVGEAGDRQVGEEWDAEPETAYGRSKRAAETALRGFAERGLEVVVLRPAMVYGPGCKGNLPAMMRWVAKGWFPPLPETGNRRSLVHVDDLLDAMLRAAQHPEAAGRTYVVAAREAFSGRALYDALRRALGMPPSGRHVRREMLAVAARAGDLLRAVGWAGVPFHSAALSRLLDSAWYSAAAIECELGWQARVTLDEGLAGMLDNRAGDGNA